jgi:nucleotide-binding universal stress UspA family protein
MKESKMQPKTCIVAGTDFSTAADRAVKRAAQLAKELGAELHLIHVLHPLDLRLGSELSFGSQLHYENSLQMPSQSQLDTLASLLHKEYEMPIKVVTCFGHTYTEIASYATSQNASLIVVGARGENENIIPKLLLGSTAWRILRTTANCPVLIVRNAEAKAYRQIIACMDFSPGSAEVPVFARRLAPDAHIEMLHIFDSAQEVRMRKMGVNDDEFQKYNNDALIEVDKKLDRIRTDQRDSRITHKVITGYPAAEICARAITLFADLIVIGRHGMSGIQEWLLGSVSKNVSQAATCDVLVVKQQN